MAVILVTLSFARAISRASTLMNAIFGGGGSVVIGGDKVVAAASARSATLLAVA